APHEPSEDAGELVGAEAAQQVPVAALWRDRDRPRHEPHAAPEPVIGGADLGLGSGKHDELSGRRELAEVLAHTASLDGRVAGDLLDARLGPRAPRFDL